MKKLTLLLLTAALLPVSAHAKDTAKKTAPAKPAHEEALQAQLKAVEGLSTVVSKDIDFVKSNALFWERLEEIKGDDPAYAEDVESFKQILADIQAVTQQKQSSAQQYEQHVLIKLEDIGYRVDAKFFRIKNQRVTYRLRHAFQYAMCTFRGQPTLVVNVLNELFRIYKNTPVVPDWGLVFDGYVVRPEGESAYANRVLENLAKKYPEDQKAFQGILSSHKAIVEALESYNKSSALLEHRQQALLIKLEDIGPALAAQMNALTSVSTKSHAYNALNHHYVWKGKKPILSEVIREVASWYRGTPVTPQWGSFFEELNK